MACQRKVNAVVVVLLFLSGCSKKEASLDVAAPAASSAVTAETAGGSAIRRPDTLAHEHTVSIELSKELLPQRLRDVEHACAADTNSGCTILEASLRWHEGLPNGSIRMRLAPGGVDTLVTSASKDGVVTERSSHAEDLAQPVADAERELALLNVHSDRLVEMMKSKDLKIDQLIIVSKELATVQAQIDSLGSQHANLRRRIDTDLLTINMSLPMADYRSEATPIKDALQTFGSNFREAVAMVISFIAVLVPWLVVIAPGLVLVRFSWRKTGRWLSRREQPIRA